MSPSGLGPLRGWALRAVCYAFGVVRYARACAFGVHCYAYGSFLPVSRNSEARLSRTCFLLAAHGAPTYIQCTRYARMHCIVYARAQARMHTARLMLFLRKSGPARPLPMSRNGSLQADFCFAYTCACF